MFNKLAKGAIIGLIVTFGTNSMSLASGALTELTQEERLVVSEVMVLNGQVNEAQRQLGILAKEGFPEAQYVLYNNFRNGLVSIDLGMSDDEVMSLLSESAKNGYLPAIHQRILEIELSSSSDEELIKNEEWRNLIELGFKKDDVGLSLSYARLKIYNDKIEDAGYIIDKISLLAKDNGSQELNLFLGDYYSLHEFQISEAQKWYLRAVRMGNEIAANNLAYLWSDNDMHLEYSLYLSRFAVSMDPSPNNLDTLGWIHFKMKEFEKAYEIIKSAYTQDSTNWEITFHLAMAAKEIGQSAEAINYFMISLDMLNDLGKNSDVDKNLQIILNELNELIEETPI